MAKPIERTFNQSKNAVIDAFPKAAKAMGMRMIGCHYDLGMLSLSKKGKRVYHGHVVEQDALATKVELAPGFSFMKERDQSELPVSTLENILDALQDALREDEIAR